MGEVMMPVGTTVAFAHATLQVIAEEVGADVLHIKGPAVEPLALGLSGDEHLARRVSIDADVLVRPSHVKVLLDAMHRHDWVLLYDFKDGSPFEHAATLGHAGLANVDLHRFFPGIELDPEMAFERLWRDRRTFHIAGYPVQVPSVAAQRLILVLHAARGRSASRSFDLDGAWGRTSPAGRIELQELAIDVKAQVALAAGTGRLNTMRGERSYLLWSALSKSESSQVRLWKARVSASGSRRAGLRTAVRLVVPKRQRLAIRFGRPPTKQEIARAYLQQIRRGLRALARDRRAHARGPR